MDSMATAPPPHRPRPPLGATDELRAAWERFRGGGVVPCPLDGAHLALAVEALTGIYRFVCTQCGAASPWFESGPNGIRLRELSGDQLPRDD
jgi:hypothetical protein